MVTRAGPSSHSLVSVGFVTGEWMMCIIQNLMFRWYHCRLTSDVGQTGSISIKAICNEWIDLLLDHCVNRFTTSRSLRLIFTCISDNISAIGIQTWHDGRLSIIMYAHVDDLAARSQWVGRQKNLWIILTTSNQASNWYVISWGNWLDLVWALLCDLYVENVCVAWLPWLTNYDLWLQAYGVPHPIHTAALANYGEQYRLRASSTGPLRWKRLCGLITLFVLKACGQQINRLRLYVHDSLCSCCPSTIE